MFNEYHSVDKACKKFLFTLIPEVYFRSFKNKYSGYASVKFIDILSHLWTTYGVLQDCEVQENDVRMKQPISAKTLFEEFVEQIKTAVNAVATQVPYTRQKIVSIAFTMVENSRIYCDGVKEWRQKYTADKTWEAFKTFFAKRVQRYQSPTTDISFRRIWDNNQHERRTRQRRGNRIATATGGSASEFGNSYGSRHTGSGRAIHNQGDADT